uniref:Peptidase C1A papain C-terminal domain-containing protein n=1 Tax=Chromera velia CCMP2878 TaxID=1169474 RepID=A0A0G4F3B8_9ALVE|eukprot:Cvel_14873.t1-p1 / transcript=Cvel_14873.t1 / gene=Cvel_14873 / organism=Chromera_velia_CCMP2878 / gene_product=Macrodontain-1, putative / transcript_product=Macrodontain-1, putative / location=Cvel_scaffold1076:8982-13880(-) / protein_length=466 / sequence_SO=supercontig / SO=protein_coding / is_pseudo=false
MKRLAMCLSSSLIVLLPSLALGTPHWAELTKSVPLEYSFEDFIQEFEKVYADDAERSRRRTIYSYNVEKIRVHNENPKASWKMGINEFTDMEEDEDAFFGLDFGMSVQEKTKRRQKQQEVEGRSPAQSGLGSVAVSGPSSMVGGEASEVADDSTEASASPSPSSSSGTSENERAPLLLRPEARGRGRKDLSNLPESVDWRTSGIISPVKNQGPCGSCWAFAAADLVEAYHTKASGQLHTLSPQQLLDCTPNPEQCGGSGGCGGATVQLAYETIQSMGGIAEEWVYPYQSYAGKGYACKFPDGRGNNGTEVGRSLKSVAKVVRWHELTENSYEETMMHLAFKGPLAVSVAASSWRMYQTGVFDGCPSLDDNIVINHAVTLVGYGTDSVLGPYWLLKNTWSPKWGEGGYIRIRRHENPEAQVCGMNRNPRWGSACRGEWDTPVEVCGACGLLYEPSWVQVGRPSRPVN